MISVLYTIILITNFKLIEMCIKSSPKGRGVPNGVQFGWVWGTIWLGLRYNLVSFRYTLLLS